MCAIFKQLRNMDTVEDTQEGRRSEQNRLSLVLSKMQLLRTVIIRIWKKK